MDIIPSLPASKWESKIEKTILDMPTLKIMAPHLPDAKQSTILKTVADYSWGLIEGTNEKAYFDRMYNNIARAYILTQGEVALKMFADAKPFVEAIVLHLIKDVNDGAFHGAESRGVNEFLVTPLNTDAFGLAPNQRLFVPAGLGGNAHPITALSPDTVFALNTQQVEWIILGWMATINPRTIEKVSINITDSEGARTPHTIYDMMMLGDMGVVRCDSGPEWVQHDETITVRYDATQLQQVDLWPVGIAIFSAAACPAV